MVFFLAVITFVITAIESHGYYHGDEHYQIIEFSGIKLGTHSSDDLAWEFKKQIRPSLQPTICYFILKSSQLLGVDNPYSQAQILRISTAILALLIIQFFIKRTEHRIQNKKIRIYYHLLSYFLWFIPLLNVRFSSETWSNLFFILSISIYLNTKKNIKKYFLLGICLGLSFLFKYQISFAIIGFMAWSIIIDKIPVKQLLIVSISFLTIFLLGFILDSWFYGNTVLTPWNYFYTNIVENVSSNFGTQPWYYYPIKTILSTGFIVGIPIFISLVLFIHKKPRNIFVWCLLPYITIHLIIPHKEERFLFFILYFVPFILIYIYQLYIETSKYKILKQILFTLFIMANITGITANILKSASNGKMEITKYIYDNFQNVDINLLHTSNSNPYDPWGNLPSKFYQQKNIVPKKIENISQLDSTMLQKDKLNLLIIEQSDYENKIYTDTISKLGFVELKRSVPVWIDYLNNNYRKFYHKNKRTLILYYFP